MTVESVRWTATALVAGCLVCSGIMADSTGECYDRESYNASRSIPYKETYDERCWLFRTCVRTRTNYINEKYQAIRLNKMCCEGYGNKNGTCEQLSGCQNCHKPLTCRCDCISPSECRCVCVGITRGVWGGRSCDSEYDWNYDHEECWPKCNPSCAVNAWCQKPNTCVCEPRYAGDGTSCLPVCKQGCANGICTAPDKCWCNGGWSGDSCDKPLACVVASIAPESYSNDTLSSDLSSKLGIDVKINTSEIARTLPACDLKCPDELRMHAIGSTTSRENVTYYLIPYNGGLDLTCNGTKSEQSFLARHSNVITGAILVGTAFLIVGIIFTIICMSRGRKKSKNTPTDNIVQYTSNGCIEENILYEATNDKITIDY